MIKAKKSLGQNFLIDKNVLKKITNLTNIKDKIILEIGPGTGNLTSYILEKNPKKFIAIEKDNELAVNLKKKFHKHIKVINEDVLTVDETKLFEDEDKVTVFGNLPYNISSQILFKILEYRNKIGLVVIMLQKEVADRIISTNNSKKYGILSVLIQTFFKVRKIIEVDSKSFDPQPKVQSTVIKLIRNDVINLGIEFSFFKKVVKSSFQRRRKMLRNALKNLNLPC